MRVKDIQIGETYNQIQIISDLGYRKPDHRYGCKCTNCGKEFEISAKHIGKVKTCRECYEKSEIVDISGRRFGRLVALERVGRTLAPNGTRQSMWRCRCDCGNETVVKYIALTTGNTRSCGCGEIENRYSCNRAKRKSASFTFYNFDLEKHPLRKIWKSMLMRCNNPNVMGYSLYGGRGIKVCERWSGNFGFENFVNDMGERPSLNHSLDRIDVNGDYTPENCRWATQRLQANNRRNNNILIYKGQEITVSVLSKMLGINDSTLYNGLRNGVDIDMLITNQFRIKKGQKRLSYKFCINYNKHISLELNEYIEITPKQILGFAPKKEYKFNNSNKENENGN